MYQCLQYAKLKQTKKTIPEKMVTINSMQRNTVQLSKELRMYNCDYTTCNHYLYLTIVHFRYTEIKCEVCKKPKSGQYTNVTKL